jgi:hypothetical protein
MGGKPPFTKVSRRRFESCEKQNYAPNRVAASRESVHQLTSSSPRARIDRDIAGRTPMSDFVLPVTRYALSGEVNIAYQTMEDGPVDIIMVPGMISHVEILHEFLGYTAFLRRTLDRLRKWLERVIN